jgi:hypothetical protein
MATAPRIVAELGRPETPDETAIRKAESSRVYRSSQSFRNLIAALLATLGVVALVVLIVPRGNITPAAGVDVAAQAKQVAASFDRPVLVPKVPSSWRANSADVGGDQVQTWTIAYAGGSSGYVDVAQGFDADAGWDSRLLSGSGSAGTITIDGIVWTQYALTDSAQTGNVSYALGTDAGRDRVLIYGQTDPATAAVAARGVADQIRSLRAAHR